jgi:hypothetical protein
MTDNPYQSPSEKCEPSVENNVTEHATPSGKGHATTLGCWLGGCLFPFVALFCFLIYLSVHDYCVHGDSKTNDMDPGVVLLLSPLFLLAYIFLFPFGAVLGGMIEYFFRKPKPPGKQAFPFIFHVKKD